MALFSNFDDINNPAVTMHAIEQYAETRGISYDELDGERSRAVSQIWGPRACSTLGLSGRPSVDTVRRARGYDFVELCRTAVALAACLLSRCDASIYRIDAVVNERILAVAS